MPETPDRWNQIKDLFDAALLRPAAERDAFVLGAAPDADALAELRSLLAHHDEATGGRDFLGAAAVAEIQPAGAAARLGQRLGAWQIVRAVGAGGMGEVFEVRRADGSFEGRAAVKLLKRGMDSTAVLQRFAQERQALARLSHPHIARLLDAGVSEDGLPYFVMEYVDGRAIHEATPGLPLEQRLRLFLQLADAVAHAHRNLLVHRDLKPGNVLVDGEGQVKLLDFGIAKALDPLESADSDTTVGGVRPYTPHHASPEQVRGEPVTTATDVYSLGVLLHQMLTGVRPTGRNASTLAEAVKSVLEEQPMRPSRLGVDQARDPQWPQVRRKLQGDLDNILLKALEKTVERRYASVDAMAADVRAYLGGYPVGAHAPSPLYVLDKFLRRNRWSVVAGLAGGTGLVMGLVATLVQGRVAAALGVLGLAGGLAMALVQAQRAGAARDRAQSHLAEARAIVSDVMVRHADAVHFLPGGVGLKTELLRNMIGHLDRLAAQAGNDAAFSGDMAMAYARLAHLESDDQLMAADATDAGGANALRSLPLFKTGLPAHEGNPWYGLWWARAWSALATAARQRGDLSAALASSQQMLAVVEQALQRHPGQGDLLSELGSAHLRLGQIYNSSSVAHLGQPQAALDAFARAEAVYRGLVDKGVATGEDLHQLATVAGARMLVCSNLGRLDEAVTHGERAVQARRANLQTRPEHVAYRNGLATEANNLGSVLLDAGQAARALEYTTLNQDALCVLERDDPAFAGWREARVRCGLHHGRALAGVGRFDEAMPLLRALCDPALSPSQSGGAARVAWARLELAQCLRATGQAAAALHEAQAALPPLQQAALQSPDDLEAAKRLAACLQLLAGAEPPHALRPGAAS